MTQSSRSVGFFGGSFNPPHTGHVLAVAYALSTGEVDEVWVVPVCQHAFPKQLESYQHRVEMTRLAMAPLRCTEVSLIEQELPKPNYTLHTIRELQQRHRAARFRLIAGSDAFAERHKWFGFEELRTLAPLLILRRIGVEDTVSDSTKAPELAPAPGVLPAISSSEIRDWLRLRSARTDQLLSWYVPAKVRAYIEQHGLYRN